MSEEETNGAASNAVPYDRFVTINDQRKEAQAKAAELTARLADVTKQANAADALFTQLEAAIETLTTERANFDRERSLMGAGLLDQEARDLALWAYNRQPADGRPPLEEWLAGMRAEDATVHAYLAPYFKPPEVDAPAPAMPDTNRGAVPQGIEPGGHQKGSIAGMTAEEYSAHRDKIRQRWLKK